ncbi:hypothetical protein FAZ19_19800 [Sphingobacterium alkalisoli]|uniref:Uncharacterized protein n=1 Tax=Sphingobacterium alkalisoli TaxID=1874115 RepID=A0A4U0GUG1_9SPHI|nr:hypothetical protein [Sphingobacterium alkalisoli]TJY62715.1 hypothetical protein FAZ19_19800 [Sphingobacterium alkalisoli]GGH28394.1 hypothetical protein GCM10011418_39030 [Sphingobacterium alkalisoli]
MANKPILFSTPMVMANLEGRKTQTRRIVKGLQSDSDSFKTISFKRRLWDSSKEAAPGPLETNAIFVNDKGEGYKVKSKYQVGDVMWGRESFFIAEIERPESITDDIILHYEYRDGTCSENPVRILHHPEPFVWKPSIHMPKEAARIFLEVTDVRVERLRDIFHRDAREEGVDYVEGKTCRLYFNYLTLDYGCNELFSFMTLWQSINGIESWEKNPWVWVYKYKVVDKPKDFLS